MTCVSRCFPGLLLLVLATGGCGANDLFDAFAANSFDPTDPCRGDAGDISGLWTFDGEGSRDFCDEAYINTDRFELHSAAIPIDHDVEAGTLKLGDPELANLIQIENGTVDGVCFSFTTIENVDQQSLRIRWTGKVDNGVIRGEFEGEGPGACRSSGEFEVYR